MGEVLIPVGIYLESLGKDPLTLHMPTSNMTVTQIKKVMPFQPSPGLTRSTSDVENQRQSDDKYSTGTNHTWMRQGNLELRECYYKSRHKDNRYINCMREVWMDRKPS